MILTFNSKILTSGSKWIEQGSSPTPVDPYNPLGLPPNTVRVRTSNGNPPTKGTSTSYESATLVPGTTNEYDVYKSGTDFGYLLTGASNVSMVLGANTTGITNMQYMFSKCTWLTSVPLFDTSNATNMKSMFFNCSRLPTVPLFDTSNVTDINSMFSTCSALTSVPLFDTSNVTNISSMFFRCSSLTSIPLFDTSNVRNIANMFNSCYKVESGALALYQQASSQTVPPNAYANAFTACGRDTVTGAAELAQIPSSWGGTGA